MYKKLLPIAAIIPAIGCGMIFTTSCSNYQYSKYISGSQISITPVPSQDLTLEEMTKLYITKNSEDKYQTMFNDFCHYLIEANNWINKTQSQMTTSYSGTIELNNLSLKWDDSAKCVRANFKYKWTITTRYSFSFQSQFYKEKELLIVETYVFYQWLL